MWILFPPPPAPSTEAVRRQEKRRQENTQRYRKTYRGNVSLREMNFESGTSLKISFSMWRVLNKSNSMVCNSNREWIHGYLSVCAKSRNIRGLWRKRRAPTHLSHGEGESHLCLNGGWWVWLPPAWSWTANLQAEVPLRRCMWRRWRRAQTQSLSAQSNAPDPVHVQLNARGYQTCKKWQQSARSTARKVLLPLPPPSGAEEKHTCAQHTHSRCGS